jgi:alpha-galactosidase
MSTGAAALTDAEVGAPQARDESGVLQRRSAESFDAALDATEEYAQDGGIRYGVPTLQVRFADGTRSLELDYAGHEIIAETLVITLHDRYYPLDVRLHYRIAGDVIERFAVLHNDGDPVTVLRFDSATWVLPHRDGYRVSHVAGIWSAETQLQRRPLAIGETVFTSRRGITSHHANPWALIDDGSATEDHGEVWGIALAWSGSWRLTIQQTPFGRVSMSAGFGHDGVSWQLAPGEELATPVAAGLYRAGGFGDTSRGWHDYVRGHVLPEPAEVRPVLFNSWEATLFDIEAVQQAELAERAAVLGAELFVVDDGWFRDDDRAGLGDWKVKRRQFPDGLGPLADRVRELGMAFGIWVEPEMVNPDSDLCREHSDWVLHYPHRARSELRNQLVLNFARDDVREWAFGWLDRLVRDTGAEYVKWDMNRTFSEAGWPENLTDLAAAAAAGVSTSECSPVPTRCGRRTIPMPPIGCASSTGSPRSIRPR